MTPPLHGTSADALTAARRVSEDWHRLGVQGAYWARSLDDGGELGFAPDRPVALASVAKLPLALVVLDRIERGLLDARTPVVLDPATSTPGPTGVSTFDHPCTLTIGDLVRQMLAVSDNAAADALFDLVPPEAATSTLRDWRVHDVVLRHGLRALYDAMEVVAPGDVALAFELAARAATEGGGHVLPSLDVASASTGTARSLVDLLRRIWADDIGAPAATARLRPLLGGPLRTRMSADLASDTVRVRSRTGTFLNLRHEVGVVEAPDASVAVACLTVSTVPAREQPAVDDAIGRAARWALDALR